MKEINEKNIYRAKTGVIVLGIIRGILYTVGGLLTFIYSYLLLNGTTTSYNGFYGRSSWYINAYMYFMGVDEYREFYRMDIDFDRMQSTLDSLARIEDTVNRIGITPIYVTSVLLILVTCAVLYFISRAQRRKIALSEADV